MTLRLTSPAFAEGSAIARPYTCDGQGRSLPLSWSDAPAATCGFALVCDDPDAPGGTFSHWAVWNIPSTRQDLPEGLAGGCVVEGMCQGTNDFGRNAYGPPCPPRGHGAHRYVFRLYALDVAQLDLPSHAKVPEVERAAMGHALAVARLTGTYERRA